MKELQRKPQLNQLCSWRTKLSFMFATTARLHLFSFFKPQILYLAYYLCSSAVPIFSDNHSDSSSCWMNGFGATQCAWDSYVIFMRWAQEIMALNTHTRKLAKISDLSFVYCLFDMQILGTVLLATQCIWEREQQAKNDWDISTNWSLLQGSINPFLCHDKSIHMSGLNGHFFPLIKVIVWKVKCMTKLIEWV